MVMLYRNTQKSLYDTRIVYDSQFINFFLNFVKFLFPIEIPRFAFGELFQIRLT